MTFFSTLKQRGLIKQSTHEDQISDLLEDKCTFYIGFDPTADSLHVGHLMQIIFAKRLIERGHQGIMLVGDATAQIGDPTGRSSVRPILTQEQLDHNVTAIEKQLQSMLPTARMVNNLSWVNCFTFLGFMKEIGSCFSVNSMLKADCFSSRMANGLSFLEFSYMLFQAADFLHLNTQHDCRLQIGGDDQWSNILAGVELIHKKNHKQSFGMTIPLLLNSNGEKIGKTVNGAIWLDPKKTSILDFFQFWRNIPDTDVKNCLLFMTDFTEDQINNWGINEAKVQLAKSITGFVHGTANADLIADQVFEIFDKNFDGLTPTIIDDGVLLIDVICSVDFATSKNKARQLIIGGGITLDGKKITDVNIKLINQGKEIILCKGKKHFAKLKFR